MDKDLTYIERFDRLRAAAKAAGFPLVTERGKGTAAESWTRALIALHMYRAGAIDCYIGTLLCRERSSVTAKRIRADIALERPEMYHEVATIDNQIRKAYHDIYGQDL
jgi:hypothetical protein